jgi:DNA-binding GntR family transcriptional regulator
VQAPIEKADLEPAIRPAKRLTSFVYDELKNLLMDGAFAPNQRLSVDELGRQFEVSRQPIMDALRRLDGEGFVEIIPQVGCRVTSYDIQAIRDFVSIFGGFQGEVAALAAGRRTADQIATLGQLLNDINRIPSTRGPEQRRLCRDFHRCILEMAHSEITETLCAEMWDFGDFLYSTFCGEFVVAELITNDRHAQANLVDAIRHGDASLARLNMELWLTGVLALMPAATR